MATTDRPWVTDSKCELVTIAKVSRIGDHYQLTREDGWTLSIDDPGFEPKAGQKARFYGDGIGYPVRGVVIEGRLCYYRTADEQKQHLTDRLYPRTAAEALAKWDAGQSVFSIAMGGIGPGYEQAIQVLAFELIRAALSAGLMADGSEPFKTGSPWEIVADATVERFGQYLGLSGAQVSAAEWLAYKTVTDGWQKIILAHPDERRIQVSNSWPHIPDDARVQAA